MIILNGINNNIYVLWINNIKSYMIWILNYKKNIFIIIYNINKYKISIYMFI